MHTKIPSNSSFKNVVQGLRSTFGSGRVSGPIERRPYCAECRYRNFQLGLGVLYPSFDTWGSWVWDVIPFSGFRVNGFMGGYVFIFFLIPGVWGI